MLLQFRRGGWVGAESTGRTQGQQIGYTRSTSQRLPARTVQRAKRTGEHFVGSRAFEARLGPCCRAAPGSRLATSLTIFSQAVQKIVSAPLHCAPLPPPPPSNCWLQAPGSLPDSSPPIDSTGLQGESGVRPASLCNHLLRYF